MKRTRIALDEMSWCAGNTNSAKRGVIDMTPITLYRPTQGSPSPRSTPRISLGRLLTSFRFLSLVTALPYVHRSVRLLVRPSQHLGKHHWQNANVKAHLGDQLSGHDRPLNPSFTYPLGWENTTRNHLRSSPANVSPFVMKTSFFVSLFIIAPENF